MQNRIVKTIVIIISFCLGIISEAKATDISKYDNVIYAENVSADAGSTISLSIKMKNVIAMTGFQFDIVLPTGFSVAEDEDGFYLIDLSTARTTAKRTDYFNSVKQSDGAIRVMCSSTKSLAFSGNDGEVCTIVLKIASSVTDNIYPIILKNIVMSDATSTTYKVSQTETSITIGKGATNNYHYDVNNDGVVDIKDVTDLVDHLVGKQ